jgi:hypothetical protein
MTIAASGTLETPKLSGARHTEIRMFHRGFTFTRRGEHRTRTTCQLRECVYMLEVT